MNTLATLALALCLLAPSGPADAQQRIAATGQLHELHSQSASGTVAVDARLETAAATGRVLVELRVQCAEGESVWTTQNMARGQQRAVLRARAMLQAEGQCTALVRALLPGDPAGDPSVGFDIVSSSLSIQQNGRARAESQTQRLPRSGALDALRFSWLAPETVDTVTVVADTQLTNCYGPARECTTEPTNTLDAVVDTQLVVMQRATGSGYCAVTRGPVDRTRVTWSEHHQKNYHQLAVPISRAPGCTRSLTAKVYMRWVSGNEVLVEGPTSQGGWYSAAFFR